MKILICHSSLGSGGIESMVVNLANEMSKSHDVSVLTIFKPRETDICFKRLSGNIKTLTLGKNKPGISLSLLLGIIRLFLRNQYDVVHLNGFFYYYFLAVILFHHKTKFFYTVHNDAVQENCLWDRYLIWLKKFCFKYGWMYAITISNTSQKSFMDLYHADNTLIYNGVPKPNCKTIDVSQYKFTDNTRIILNPARISVQKNQLMLCRVVTRLLNEGYDCCLLIAGSNDDRRIFSTLEPFFCERIVYLGERNDAVDIMNSVDAMALSSGWEGMPVTLVESLSVGCVPICTPVGGICDVVKDNQNGILSSDTSEEAYYLAMKRFLEMKQSKLDEMRNRCRIDFSKYDIEMTAKEYINLFRSKRI